MILKKAVVQNCSKCGRFEKEISPEGHGCDYCEKPIVPYGNDERLDVRIFHHNDGTETYYFCSWKCVLSFVKRLKSDYFFTLPYASAEHTIQGRRAKDLIKLIRQIPGLI